MSDTNERTGFEGWAIVQQMGHVKIAGYVTEVQLAGFGVLSVAIPDGDRMVQKLIPPSTLYDLTWVGEAEARFVAKRSPIEPVSEWDIRQEARERIEQNERESIETRTRRTVEREQQDAARAERRRVLDILSDAKAVAQTVVGAVTESTLASVSDLQAATANRLMTDIDTYCEESHQRLRGEPQAMTYAGGVDDDDRYGDDYDDDEPPL